MSLTYRSSFSFSKPSNFTISHANIEDALYDHKKRLWINQRSTSKDNSYRTQRLSIKQAKTIENLSKKTKVYSLNALLKNYNHIYEIDNFDLFDEKLASNPQTYKKNKKLFQTIQSGLSQTSSRICPQKMKLFKQGVNYRSQQRSKGVGVKRLNLKDLEDYFQRTPQQESGFHQLKKSKNTIVYNNENDHKVYKFNRVKSCRLVN